jgi:hypothetical protein
MSQTPYLPCLAHPNFFKNAGLLCGDRGARFYKLPLNGTNSTKSKTLIAEIYIVPYGIRSQRVFFRFLSAKEELETIVEQMDDLENDDNTKEEILEIITAMIHDTLRYQDQRGGQEEGGILYRGTNVIWNDCLSEVESLLDFSIGDVIIDEFRQAVSDKDIDLGQDGLSTSDVNRYSSRVVATLTQMGLYTINGHVKVGFPLNRLIEEEEWESKSEKIKLLLNLLEKKSNTLELLLTNPNIRSEDILRVRQMRGGIASTFLSDEEFHLIESAFDEQFGRSERSARGNPTILIEKRDAALRR